MSAMRRPREVAVLLGLIVAATGCGDDSPAARGNATSSESPTRAGSPTAAGTSAPSETPTPSASAAPSHKRPPCNPGGGFPRPRAGCPDPDPDTGWVSVTADGQLVLQPFRTYTGGEEARAYAEAHGLEFPFPNDYYDASVGERRPLELSPRTVCTGIIIIGYEEPLADHVVDCEEFRHARDPRVPAAVWIQDSSVLQLSELYRP